MRRPKFIALLLLLLLTPLALVLALPWLAEPGLRLGLRAAGLGQEASFEGLDVGLGRAELRGLRVGGGDQPDLALDRLYLDYDAAGLTRGRLQAVRLEGLVVRGRLDEAGLHLDVLDGFGAATDGRDADGGGPLPGLPVPTPERAEVSSGRFELATPYGDLVLPFSAEARLVDGGRRATVAIEVAGASLAAAPPDGFGGTLRGDLELTGAVALDVLPAAGAVTAEGVLTLAADEFDLPGVAGGIEGGGPIDLALSEGRLSLDLRGFELTAPALEPELALLAELLPPPLKLKLGDAGAPLALSLDLERGAAGGIAAAGPLALAAAAGARLAADIEATIAPGAGGTPFRLAASELSAVVTDVTWGDLAVPRAELAVRAEGTPAALEAELDLDLAAEGEPVAGLQLDDARLRLPLGAELDDGRVTLRLREAGMIAAEAVRFGAGVRTTGPVELTLDAGAAGPLFEAALGPDGDLTAWRHRLALLPAPVTASVATEAAPIELRGTTPRIELELEEGGAGHVRLAGGGRLEVPAYDLSLADFGAELPLAGGGLAAHAPVSIEVGTVRHTGDPPWFRPVALRAVLRPEGQRLAFRVDVEGGRGALAAAVEGRHDFATGAGRAALEVEPLAFAPDGLQPGQLIPPLAGVIRDVAGVIDLGGTLAWRPGAALDTDLVLVANNLGLSAGPARLERVNGAIEFDSILPPSTPPGQLLAVGLLDIGLPLVNGVVEFRLEEDGALVVDRARWRWAGGEVGTGGAFAYRPGEPLDLTLRANGLEIAELLEQVELGGLEGTGTLSGALPLRVEGGAVIVDEGELKAQGPGWLRYRPEETPAALQAGGGSVDLMLRALENFRYESLRITLDGRTDTEMDVGLHVSGANPDLYGGYPVEFNLNLEGELGAVLQAGIEGYRMPERIAERMQRLRDR